jgi:hypothetical protein
MTREELENQDEFETPDENQDSPIVDDDGMFDLSFGDEDEVSEVREEETEVPVEESEEIEETEDSEEVEEVEEEDTEEEYSEDEDSEEIFTDFVNLGLDKGVLKIYDDKDYDDSEEGLAEIFKDTVDISIKEKLASYPEEVQRLIEIAEKGGDIRDAFEEMYSFDYKDLDLTDDSIKTELVKDHLLKQGYEESELEDMVEGLKDINKLDKAAETAQKYFIKEQEAERGAYTERLDQERAEQARREEETIREVAYKIDTMESIGIFGNIPKQDRESFKRYLFERDETGKTQAQKDNSLDAIIINEFNKFKKFDYSVVQNRAKTKSTIDWRKKAARVKDNVNESRGATSRRYTKPEDPSIFSIGDID